MADYLGDIASDFGGAIACERVREDFSGWLTTGVRLALIDRDSSELGMYLEGGCEAPRKRKPSWTSNSVAVKLTKMEDDGRRQPVRKLSGAGEMGNGGGGSNAGTHLSPAWQVNDLDIDLSGDLAMNEALLSLPSLTVFKQEAPSPPGGVEPRRAWHARHRQQMGQVCSEAERSSEVDMPVQSHRAMQALNAQVQNGQEQMMTGSYGGGGEMVDAKSIGAGVHMSTGVSAMEFTPAHSSTDNSYRDDLRFQYVLAAATSIATKTNEETLTYLNQGQSYEIKLKKLGDLSQYKEKIFKSIIRICFHERRLQYMEKEQMAQWHKERPGHRILEVDIPLSYGLIQVSQPPSALNTVELLWDPTKDVGIYIKVNCISTEFTAKKHGGEKGVPFRVQVETYLSENRQRLHAAACQIKVFKLKGADRKHKQDREKVMRRSRPDLEHYQPSCDCTVLTDLPNDAVLPPPPPAVVSSPGPELGVPNVKPGSPKSMLTQPVIFNTSGSMKGFQDCDLKSCSGSPSSVATDLPDQTSTGCDKSSGLHKEATASETRSWLLQNRFVNYEATFANFAGADLLRLSRDDLIQICGLADGIRLYNALRAKMVEPRCVLYVRPEGQSDGLFSAIYLHTSYATELRDKLMDLAGISTSCEVAMCGPGGARLRLTDELASHIADKSVYILARIDGNRLLLTPTEV